jgi:hypothetical protein
LSYYRPGMNALADDDEANPYGQVWLPLAFQVGILLVVVIAIYLIFRLFAPSFPRLIGQALDVVLALLPLGLWLYFGWWRERSAIQPRQRLLMVAIISALATNAVALPLIDQVYQVERWLAIAPTATRVLGFTFTVGASQAMVIYLVVRYLVWRDYLRDRSDAVAYAIASAVGYATVLNLQFVFNSNANLDIAAIRVFDNISLLYAGSLIIAFGLSEMRFEQPTPFFMPLMVALSSFLSGIIIPLRTGFTNAGFAVQASVNAPSLILGTIISLGVFVAVTTAAAGLFNTAARRAREAQAAREP